MEEKIKVIYGDEDESSIEILNKLRAEQKILELFETRKIREIEITYKKREQACEARKS